MIIRRILFLKKLLNFKDYSNVDCYWINYFISFNFIIVICFFSFTTNKNFIVIKENYNFVIIIIFIIIRQVAIDLNEVYYLLKIIITINFMFKPNVSLIFNSIFFIKKHYYQFLMQLMQYQFAKLKVIKNHYYFTNNFKTSILINLENLIYLTHL